MGLISCKECHRSISDTAPSCPHCGYVYKASRGVLGKPWGFEYKSKAHYGTWPLVHIAFGRDENRRLRVAKGVIAIGQFAIGVITIAQFGIGLLFGFGQFIFGGIAIAQFAGGMLFGLGQFAYGYVAIGQFAIGYYVRAFVGFGPHVWSKDIQDPVAIEFFNDLWILIKNYLPKG
ncbi:hypothetical protein ACFL1E_06490 [Candidatus Omnitrophota bacterium]